MRRVKQASKSKRMSKSVPVLGAAGLTFSLVGGASAAVAPTTDAANSPTLGLGHQFTLGEEEIADVSLATFYVFDKENAAAAKGGVQVARGCGCGGCGGRAAVAGVAAAGVAEAAAVAAVAVAAVCPGELAASAKSDRFPIALNRSLLAGFDVVDPANPCFRCSAGRIRAVVRPHMTAEWVPNLVEKCRRPSWSERIPLVGKLRPAKLSRSGKQAVHADGAVRRPPSQIQSQRRQRHPAIRAEFLGLCAAARRRLPLLRGPQVLSSRRALLRPRLRHRKGRQEPSRARCTSCGRNFPSDKVEEALKRLIERRYIVPATDSSAGAVAGYWASLGLPPGIAEQNLGKLPRAR